MIGNTWRNNSNSNSNNTDKQQQQYNNSNTNNANSNNANSYNANNNDTRNAANNNNNNAANNSNNRNIIMFGVDKEIHKQRKTDNNTASSGPLSSGYEFMDYETQHLSDRRNRDSCIPKCLAFVNVTLCYCFFIMCYTIMFAMVLYYIS